MIPPVAPGQTVEKQNMVGWKNTFNMRQVSLMNLASTQMGVKNSFKSIRPSSSAKSLDLLRKNLQNAINKDIDNIIKKYLETFFQPAIHNIRNNLGKDSVGEEHIKQVCKNMLEEAKIMYKSSSRDSSPYDYSDSDSGKRKESDTDSETNQPITGKIKKTQKSKNANNSLGCDFTNYKLPVKRDGPKWNPNRMSENTLFIMGARANKVLGYGQTRGRLYVRHPNLVRYSGDQEDKEWLASKNLMPPSGGKAYLMLLEDIEELTRSDEYKNNPNLQMHELKGFQVPPFLLTKMKNFIDHVRTDKTKKMVDIFEFTSHSGLLDPILPESTTSKLEGSPYHQSVSSTLTQHSPIPTSTTSTIHSSNMMILKENNLALASILATNSHDF
ncbi:unnamed protein product [Brassicogethes aeneus]|uniref:Deoxynucleotidyltransferase terminal-interacting protein 1 n=1 Tax=Brassicogethes aeneus TaxID=1431903 RepID=A0A9P0B6H6_BRAAE|nr:unnamed protein product [Brassicogethes aeneus]